MMKRHILVAAFAAAALAPIAASAMEPDRVAPGNALLTVSAEGKSTRAPDIALFSAGVTTTGKTAGQAMVANAAAMTRVIAALKAAGVAARDIQTANLSLNPQFEDAPKPDNIPPASSATRRATPSRSAPAIWRSSAA